MKHRSIALVIAYVVGLALVALLRKPLLILFAGVLFALVLRALATLLHRLTKLPYGVSVAAVLLLLGGAMAGFAVVFGPAFATQLGALAEELPQAITHATEVVRKAPLAKAIAPDAPATQVKSLAANALLAASTLLEAGGALAVVFFVGVYGAAKPHDYAKAMIAVLPSRYRDRAPAVIDDVTAALTRWLLGRLAAMGFVGVSCSIAFHFLGVPLALALGVFAGLLTFVEYVGAIISAIPPLLLALTHGPGTAVGVLIVYSVLHVVEGYVLTPLLARASVRLPPAITLSGQVLLAALVGTLGLTFATPLLVVGVSGVRAWRRVRAENAPSNDG